MTQIQTIGQGSSMAAMEAEIAEANLSLYVRLTPIDEIQWDRVSAAWDRLYRNRTEG